MKRLVQFISALMVLSLLSACSLIQVNEERDRQQVVATVGGENLLKGEVLDLFNMVAAYNGINDYRSTNGQALMKQVRELLVEQMVQRQKAAELNITLTEDEKAEVRADLEKQYADTLKQYQDYYKQADETLTDEEALAKAEELLVSGGFEMEAAVEEQIEAKVLEKLKEKVTENVSAEDSELQERYNSLMTSQTESFDLDPSKFPTTYASTTPYVYVPVDFARIKHILINFTTAEQESLADLEEAAFDEENRVKDEEAYAAYEKRLNEIVAEGGYDVKAQVILDRINAGEDFDTLMEEFGEDPGMKGDYKDSGYLVWADNKDFVYGFRVGALELAADGDVSGLVPTTFGVHILKRVGTVAQGGRSFADVETELRALVLTEKKNTTFNTLSAEWLAAANVKNYDNRLK